MNARVLSAPVLTLLATLAAAQTPPPPPLPEVEVVKPTTKEVTDYEDFTGRTEAAASVQLRPRVSGQLLRAAFTEGGEVKKGDLLFEIDPRLYQAEVKKAEASVALAQAKAKVAEFDVSRNKKLAESNVISREEFDRALAVGKQAQAEVKRAQAELDIAVVNLSFTRVAAPLDGHIGRRLAEPGSIVKADDTDLATITVRRPMLVTFGVDERTYLRLRRMLMKEKTPAVNVTVGLSDEKDFPTTAKVDFNDAQLDPQTGTLRYRASLPNADGLLVPGLFVRVRVSVGQPHKAMVVPSRALTVIRRTAAAKTEPNVGLVYVANDKDELDLRRVSLGRTYGDSVAVKEGLKDTDRVVVAMSAPVMPYSTTATRVTVKKAAGAKNE